MTHKRAYALTPVKQPIVAGANGLRVHLYTPNLFKFCRGPRAGLEKGTHTLAHVTCPDCLKLLNLAHPKQSPRGSLTGATGPSVDPAHEREQADHHHASSSFGGSPASVSAGAGFLLG